MVNAGRSISRRQFLTTAAIAPLTLRGTATPKIVPVGLEMYSVRDELARDLPGTLTAVAGMLLMPFDQVFQKNGVGTEIPFKIDGTRSDPHFGLDFNRLKK